MNALVVRNGNGSRLRIAAAMAVAVSVAFAGVVFAAAPAQARVWVNLGDIAYEVDTSNPSEGAVVTGYTGGPGDVVIPDEIEVGVLSFPVTAIGDFALYNRGLTGVTIPDSVTAIGIHALGYNSLSAVTIPDSVTTIGTYAFGDNRLTALTIPDSVTEIGEFAFFDNLLTSVVIPSSVTTLERGVFLNNQLAAVTIPDSVTTIGLNAFWANNLLEVTIPASVTSIAAGAFGMNYLLNRVELLGPEPAMGDAASDGPFGDPGALTVYYPKRYEATGTESGYTSPVWKGYRSTAGSVVEFDANGGSGSMVAQQESAAAPLAANAFTRDGFRFTGWNTEADGSGTAYADLAEYAFRANATLYAQWEGIPPVIGTVDHIEYVARDGKAAVVGYDGPSGAGITIPRQITIDGETFEVTSIGDSAFFEKGITAVTIPDTVTAIGRMAFQRNRLTALIIPDSVRTIGREAFADNWLTSLTISATLSTIENGVFLANRLTSVVIPDSVTEIELNAFWANQLTSVVLSDSLTTIGAYAFGYNDIAAVTIPASVTEIGFAAFSWGGKTVKRVDFLGPAPELEMTSDGGPFGTGGLSGAVLYFPKRYAGTGYVGGVWHGYTTVAGFTVRFDAHGGAGRMDSRNVPQGSPLQANAFTRDGYAFTGWNTAEDGSGTSYADRAPGAFEDDATLYAQWERIVIAFTKATVSGSPKVGAKLSAVVSAEHATAYRYQWLRNGRPIAGATSSSYLLTAADRGARLSVEATASAPHLDTVSKTSAAVTVGYGSLSGATPKIRGTVKVGKKLKATPGTWTAGTKLGYRWYVNGKAVRGATKATFTIPKSAKGKKVTVKVTGTQSGYTKLVKTSKATKKVK